MQDNMNVLMGLEEHTYPGHSKQASGLLKNQNHWRIRHDIATDQLPLMNHISRYGQAEKRLHMPKTMETAKSVNCTVLPSASGLRSH